MRHHALCIELLDGGADCGSEVVSVLERLMG